GSGGVFLPVSTSGGNMPNGSKPQILVVDDDPCIRETLGMLLMSVGYAVAEAENSVSAVPVGVIADGFYPKGQHPHNLLTTIASLIATNPSRGSGQENRSRPRLDS